MDLQGPQMRLAGGKTVTHGEFHVKKKCHAYEKYFGSCGKTAHRLGRTMRPRVASLPSPGNWRTHGMDVSNNLGKSITIVGKVS
jgi:hypothetical protein